MKVILLEKVRNVGERYEVLDVANGYAQNFLLPEGLAKLANKANLKELETARAQWDQDKEQKKQSSLDLAEKLQGVEITIEKEANEKGVLFGSVGPDDIKKALQSEGYEGESKIVSEPIKEVGESMVKIQFPYDVEVEVKVLIKPN